ncbi:MAG: DUF1538 domain-containing protein [Oscillospiraceae bacterium]|jgi:hypothetical protein|nr:DUF1538 domain-containing protein [Oscillospiraceae bacterium]
MNALGTKAKEVLIAVLPLTGLVLLAQLCLFLAGTPLPGATVGRFLLGALLVVVGLSLFLFGVDLGIAPLGTDIGSFLTRKNKLWVLAAGGFVVGFFICVAEPDLQILAAQVAGVTSQRIGQTALLIVVSLGIAVMLVAGHIRIVYNFPLYKMLTVLYLIIFALALFSPPAFLAIAFDASGATTGALTVPFILSMALGVSAMKRDSKASEKDSFGLVGVASAGAVLSVLLMGLLAGRPELSGVLPAAKTLGMRALMGHVAQDALVAILPIAVIFLAFQLFAFRFAKRRRRRILVGLAYTCLGLSVFLLGVNVGFMDIGVELGRRVVELGAGWAVTLGAALGLVTIMAEPAVHVLTRQIDEVTAGYVPRRVVLGALCLGVAAAVGLSILRVVVPGIQLWHYLLPGFALAILLSFVTPKLFVGIAFDSGGVASGPMTATFILAFSQGVADAVAGADVLRDAFGMVAMVAMMPIVTLQILGLIFKFRSRKRTDNHETV